MAINRLLWKVGFTLDEIPAWNCPVCGSGTLQGNNKTFTVAESNLSKSYHSDPDWDAAWISGSFIGTLMCSNSKCQEKIYSAGKMDVRDFAEYYGESGEYDVFGKEVLEPHVFIPTLKIFEIGKHVPETIQRKINDAFHVYWIDSSACANKIRIVVESLMDHFRIKKTTIDKKGKRQTLALHHRIIDFTKKFPEEGSLLMAVKWIGNFGSHSSTNLTHEDALDGLDILDHVVNKLFETESKRIGKLSKTINRNKGPRKK